MKSASRVWGVKRNGTLFDNFLPLRSMGYHRLPLGYHRLPTGPKWTCLSIHHFPCVQSQVNIHSFIAPFLYPQHAHVTASNETRLLLYVVKFVCIRSVNLQPCFCSELEKKTTLDQSLRGVLGDQIVSTHVCGSTGLVCVMCVKI